MEKNKKNKQNKKGLHIKNWVEKSNEFVEMKNTYMTATQMRLLAIYVSKINPKDKKSREVSFKLEEYTKIMQFKQTNITRLKQSADDLLRVIITFWNKQEEGETLQGFKKCQLFKRFSLEKINNEWVVNIDCHDDVLPLMFELTKYVKYELWNILQLPSSNQQRIYELLKQYETLGERVISVNDLREMLGLKPEEHPRWDNFRRCVLEQAQKALEKSTDIKFTWEAVRGRGKGGKITAVKFRIEKNNNGIRQFTFDDYIEEQNEAIIDDDIKEFECSSKDIISFLSEACNNEFSTEEMKVLQSLIAKIVPCSNLIRSWDLDMYDFLHDKYTELNWRATQRDIKNRFGYLKTIIESSTIDRKEQTNEND